MDQHPIQEKATEVVLTETEQQQAAAAEVKPVSKADRIQTIDIIRGIALCGILMMNIPGFGIDWIMYDQIFRGPHSGADFYTLGVINVFFEGTMRGLFSMLFGAGIILFTMNKKPAPGQPPVSELFYRRLLLLVAFGVINAFVLLWRGDILFFYGLTGMLLYPFRKASAKWLIALGVFMLAAGTFKNNLWYQESREQRIAYLEAKKAEKEGKELTEEQKGAIASWTERENWRPDPRDSERRIGKMRGDYGTVFQHYLGVNAGNETWGTYHWAIFDCTGMMLIGMALFSIGFFSNRFKTSSYVMCLMLGYGIGIPIGYFIFTQGDLQQINYGQYLDRFRVDPRSLYDVKRVFLSIGHASLAMLVFRSRIIPWLMKGLAAVGQMAFTNYLMQSIICTLFFYGYGLNYYHKLRYHQLYYVVGAVWIFQIIFSLIWLRYFKFGPFEWLWRSATYWKQQPMKIRNQ